MAIDIGMGNPLALVNTGIDAVKGIYEASHAPACLRALKPTAGIQGQGRQRIQHVHLTTVSNFGELPLGSQLNREFNCLQSEQDQLITKLREQHFFEKFSYDAQVQECFNVPAVDSRSWAGGT